MNRGSVNKVSRNNPQRVTPHNLRRLCWLNGFEGVAGLARHLGRPRTTIHRAVKDPETFHLIYPLILAALSNS